VPVPGVLVLVPVPALVPGWVPVLAPVSALGLGPGPERVLALAEHSQSP